MSHRLFIFNSEASLPPSSLAKGCRCGHLRIREQQGLNPQLQAWESWEHCHCRAWASLPGSAPGLHWAFHTWRQSSKVTSPLAGKAPKKQLPELRTGDVALEAPASPARPSPFSTAFIWQVLAQPRESGSSHCSAPAYQSAQLPHPPIMESPATAK